MYTEESGKPLSLQSSNNNDTAKNGKQNENGKIEGSYVCSNRLTEYAVRKKTSHETKTRNREVWNIENFALNIYPTGKEADRNKIEQINRHGIWYVISYTAQNGMTTFMSYVTCHMSFCYCSHSHEWRLGTFRTEKHLPNFC